MDAAKQLKSLKVVKFLLPAVQVTFKQSSVKYHLKLKNWLKTQLNETIQNQTSAS